MGQQGSQPAAPATVVPQGGASRGKAQGVYLQSPWGTRIITPKGSNGKGYPYYDLDEHDIPVPPENMTERQFEQYFEDLGKMGPPVPVGKLTGPWKDAFEFAEKRRWATAKTKPNLSQRQARSLLEDYE